MSQSSATIACPSCHPCLTRISRTRLKIGTHYVDNEHTASFLLKSQRPIPRPCGSLLDGAKDTGMAIGSGERQCRDYLRRHCCASTSTVRQEIRSPVGGQCPISSGAGTFCQ